MDYLLATIASIFGVAAGFFIAHYKSKSESGRLEERNASLDEQLKEAEAKLEQESARANSLDKQLAELNADYRNLQEKLNEQKGELAKMQEELKHQFENLANKILEEKSEKFAKQNKESLDQLLNPLGEKLESFKKKVEETYNEENRQRATLKEQIRQMAEMNQKMSEDAKNLTKALKGDSKAQGNWGEVILERILEKSGLTKGREYMVQQSTTTEDGRRLQPDVIVHLPDEKYLIVDSKVSLTAYERFISSEEEEEAEEALKQHINSIRTHVKGLSAKEYQQIHGDRSPDFVLLFIPIESAFGVALQNDANLYYEAFDRNIVIVSPSTLLATLATIDSVWKQEYQNKNAKEIAEQASRLLNKFAGVFESLEDLGKRIDQTETSYHQVMNRIRDGRGSLLSYAKKLEKLGAKAPKPLPKSNYLDEEE